MIGKKKQKPRRPSGQFDTLISAKTAVEGSVHFSGGLHVDGTVRGNVVAEEGSSAVLRVSEVGEVIGDIVAPHVIINGHVEGDVYASVHLELAPKASIKGNVYYSLVEMAVGASVNGSMIHHRDPESLPGPAPQRLAAPDESAQPADDNGAEPGEGGDQNVTG